MADPMMMGAQGMPEAQGGEMAEQPGGKSVCITAMPDGTYSVHEMPTMPPEDGAEGQAAASMDEALQMAGQMLNGEQGSPEDQMMAGYNKQKPKPNGLMMGPQKVFGG